MLKFPSMQRQRGFFAESLAAKGVQPRMVQIIAEIRCVGFMIGGRARTDGRDRCAGSALLQEGWNERSA
jgi:hypothetical protein